ncbi:MAG: hypothetical protein FWF15_12290 [Oscillospiraceae bacterium]|nr:hypothetical protein [Oscillospiraceae bacterium]
MDINKDYTTKENPCAMMHGQETSNPNQPEGVYVIEAEYYLFPVKRK